MPFVAYLWPHMAVCHLWHICGHKYATNGIPLRLSHLWHMPVAYLRYATNDWVISHEWVMSHMYSITFPAAITYSHLCRTRLEDMSPKCMCHVTDMSVACLWKKWRSVIMTLRHAKMTLRHFFSDMQKWRSVKNDGASFFRAVFRTFVFFGCTSYKWISHVVQIKEACHNYRCDASHCRVTLRDACDCVTVTLFGYPKMWLNSRVAS